MIKKLSAFMVLFIMFLHAQVIRAEGFKYIEIFDPKQDRVVKVVQTSIEINIMVLGWLNGIDGIYAKNDPIKDDGYAIRFPLNSSTQVKNKWLNAIVNEVYLIIPKDNPPFFMVFENDNRLVCFLFKGDITKLSKTLDFKLK